MTGGPGRHGHERGAAAVPCDGHVIGGRFDGSIHQQGGAVHLQALVEHDVQRVAIREHDHAARYPSPRRRRRVHRDRPGEVVNLAGGPLDATVQPSRVALRAGLGGVERRGDVVAAEPEGGLLDAEGHRRRLARFQLAPGAVRVHPPRLWDEKPFDGVVADAGQGDRPGGAKVVVVVQRAGPGPRVRHCDGQLGPVGRSHGGQRISHLRVGRRPLPESARLGVAPALDFSVGVQDCAVV